MSWTSGLTGLAGAVFGTSLQDFAKNRAAAQFNTMRDNLKRQAEAKLLQVGLTKAGYNPNQAASVTTIVTKYGGLGSLKDNLMMFLVTPILNFFKVILDGLMFRGPRYLNIAVWFIVLSVVLGFTIYVLWKKLPKRAAGTAAANEGFQIVPTDPISAEEATLVNLQPLTVGTAGFMKTDDDTGRFDPSTAVREVLRTGFRSFVLPIDYLETPKGEGFEKPGHPTLLVRDSRGGIVTANSGSIEEVAKEIATTAYRPEIPNYTQPIILFLYILRAPSPVRARKEYENFLANIATALAPLSSTHLGLTPLGNFHRAKGEADLIHLPITALEGKTIIFCNADTALSRRQVKDGSIEPAKDLDYWVNMRVYLESDTSAPMGVTQSAESSENAKAIVVGLEELLERKQMKADSFSSKGRSRFTFALPSNLQMSPSVADMSRALNDFGVNCVAMQPLAAKSEEGLVKEYAGHSYRPKPVALRKVAT
jgi:hypothetical protein